MLLGNDSLRDLAKRAGVENDRRFQALINSPLLAGASREKVAGYLRALAAINSPYPHPFLSAPPRQEAEAGQIPLGRVVTGRGPEYWFRLKADEASGGILVCAPPGGGKTVLLVQLALAFHRQGYGTWLHDSEGDIAPYLVQADSNFMVLNYRDFRQELFEPDARMGLQWHEYLSKVISSWRGPLFCGNGMANLARQNATELHERQGYLTPYDFLEGLQRRKYRLSSREGNYFEALKNRFAGLILPALGPTYSGGSHDLTAMLPRSLVWQLQGLSDDVLSFFMTELLRDVSLIKQPTAGMHLDNVQFLDEFTRFCSLEQMRRATAGEIFLLDFVRTSRKRGVGMVIATQTPHLLPPQVLSDMNTWIVFRPTDGQFLDCVSRALNLDQDQEEYLMELPDRDPRQAVVRCPGIGNPFLIELPNYEEALP